MQARLIGMALVLGGGLIFAQQKGILGAAAFVSGQFLVLLLGLLLMMFSLIKQQSQLALISGIITALALFVWAKQYISGWEAHWSSLLFLLGVGILFRCAVERDQTTILVGGTFLLCGLFAWPNLHTIPLFTTLAPTLNTYWACLLVLLGGFLFLRR